MRTFIVGLRGSASTTSNCSGIFWVIKPAARQCSAIVGERQRRGPLGGLHDGTHPLAALRVGQADHRDRTDPRVPDSTFSISTG